MTPLAESVAIIFGAAEWPKCSRFEKHQAFKNSAEYFGNYLRRNGVLDENLLCLFDDEGQPSIIIEKIADFLNKRADNSIRNVLLYYVGHGTNDTIGQTRREDAQ
jgi:hypothetical protein